MEIETVERPPMIKARSKYAALYEAVVGTVGNGHAVRVTLNRTELVSARTYFSQKHPALRMVTRTLPDGRYIWAEQR